METAAQVDIMRAMARGLRKGDGGAHLITFHPTGGNGSSTWFHNDDWLDFNMRQNGHVAEFTGRYDMTRADYDRTPVKPVLDGEPIYEDHPVAFDAKKFGHSIGGDVRRPLYWNLFTAPSGTPTAITRCGRCGRRARTPVNNPLMPWYEAIDQPGAAQMQHARALLESRPFLTRIPDPDIIVTGTVPTSVPGAGRYHFRRHPRRLGQLRDGLCAGRANIQREDERHHRALGEGVVVQSAHRRGDRHRDVPEHRRARVHAAGSPAR